MTVTELVYLVAIAHVWARGTIFRPLREVFPEDATGWRKAWRSLANCPLCSGWWIGVLGHAVYQVAPGVIELLGRGSLVGTLALVVYCVIRAL